MEVIKVEGLSKSYGAIQVLKQVSFHVNQGQVFGLLGENGAGKSTTIECILGTRRFENGKVTVLGMNPRKNRKQLFERVGVQFQETNYQDKIKVNELCEATQVLYKHPLEYQELLQQFGLKDKCDSLVNELSGGQRQRLFIVLALLSDPEVVFLDELTTGLDVKARRDVWNTLLRLKRKGITIVLSSHYMDEVQVLCDRIAILKKGSIVYNGTIEDAIERSPYDSLEDAYLWYADDENSGEVTENVE